MMTALTLRSDQLTLFDFGTPVTSVTLAGWQWNLIVSHPLFLRSWRSSLIVARVSSCCFILSSRRHFGEEGADGRKASRGRTIEV